MSKEEYPYPEDEFDALGANRVPQGVHREPAPMWRQWLPYLLVLILVPVLTFGVVKYFAGDPGPEPTPTADLSAEPSDEGGDDDVDGSEPENGNADGEGTPEDEGDSDPDGEGDETGSNGEGDEPQDLNLGTHILVLNGARIQGFAGEVTDALAEKGWESTEADNYAQEAPAETTLYYTSEEFEAEAQAVGEQLEITNLVESASSASNGIVIVLRPDFSLPTGP